MATYTTNINLKKPAQSDKIRIADFNGNADSIDDAFGAGFGQSSAPSVDDEINSLASGLAIISNGDVHAAITAGQYVYVRGHSTLDDGLYIASSNISANGALSSSNLDADTSGGLNSLNNNLSTGSFTFTRVTTVLGSTTAVCRKIGHICILNLNGIFTGDSQSGWTKIGTVSVTSSHTFYSVMALGTTARECRIVGSDVSIYNPPGAGNDCLGQIVFFCT